jgi:hypothetical protein
MRKRLPLDGHTQVVHVREVRRAQPARLMHLAEKHFLGRPVLGFPDPHPSFHRPPVPLPVSVGVFALQPPDQRLGLQPWLLTQQLQQTWPDINERIRSRSPVMRRWRFTGQLATHAVLPSGLSIHARFHRCLLERCSLIEDATQFLDLRIGDLASG